ncbi:MAG: PadR family transcriptional regulator [Candidatus Bathyarchaeia archaeon]
MEELCTKVKGRCVKNALDLIILAILQDKPWGLSGYDFIGLIYDFFDIMVSPGTLYPVLFSLQKQGLVHVEFKGKKRVYYPALKGKKNLESFINCFIDANNQLNKFLRNISDKGEEALPKIA